MNSARAWVWNVILGEGGNGITNSTYHTIYVVSRDHSIVTMVGFKSDDEELLKTKFKY